MRRSRAVVVPCALLCALAFSACAVETSELAREGAGQVGLSSTSDESGVIHAVVSGKSGAVLLSLDYDPTDNRITVSTPSEDPVSFQNASPGGSAEGAELAAYYLYRASLGLRDEPGCDPPANFMTTVCLSHMCAVHDRCYADNPDKESHPCEGSVTNFWESAKKWAWGSADYCDYCNVSAIGEALQNGMYGCQASGECQGWECGCDAKQCTVDGETVCLASGDCHELSNGQNQSSP